MFSKQYVGARSLWWKVKIDFSRWSRKSDRATNPETPSLPFKNHTLGFLAYYATAVRRGLLFTFFMRKKKTKKNLASPTIRRCLVLFF